LSYNLLARAGHILRSINLETGAVQDQPVSKYSFTPAWDPANPWRVIYRDEQGLAAIDVNRGATWPLTDDSGDYTPAFSPDGKKIAVFGSTITGIHTSTPTAAGTSSPRRRSM
jgi:hypothetical protein